MRIVEDIWLRVRYFKLFPSKGERGEQRVAALLRKLPKDKYKVHNDLLFNCNDHSTQIDHIVVSPFGIFVIETKFYSGWIFGRGDKDYWTQNIYGHKYELYNPINQNFGHIKALQVLLKDFGELPFLSIVAFSRRASLRISVGSPVVYWDQVVPIILNFDKRVLSDEMVERVYEKILKVDDDTLRAKRDHERSVGETKRYKNLIEANTIRCPRCGGKLILRKGKYGEFYGCSNYPKCRYTECGRIADEM